MLSCCVEEWPGPAPELTELFQIHWKEIALFHDEIPLAPRWERYESLALSGQLLYITLRDRGTLVGYFIGFFDKTLHYGETLKLLMDIMYVRAEARGHFGGFKLLRMAEREARKRKVVLLAMSRKMHLSDEMARLLRLFGFSDIEIHSAKILRY